MPMVSTFFGIVIRMFYKEHAPLHFHAEHQANKPSSTSRGKIIAGDIQSRTARGLIRKWARLHRRQLEANWENMKAGRALDRIEPVARLPTAPAGVE